MKKGREEERETTMHLIEILVLTHASCVTKFSSRQVYKQCQKL